MEALAHGYTNDTRSDGVVVVKRYAGPGAADRHATERAVLAGLAGTLPVPPLLHAGKGELRMGFLPGVHGQDLIAAGHAARVLRACGEALHRIQTLDVTRVFPDAPPDMVLIHGDFGPNNTLLDPDTFAVTAVVDWEWARPGDRVTDLAWCEWILRMHHGNDVGALDELFAGYGHRPPWQSRRAAMLARCRALLEMCERWSPGAAALWRERTEVTAAWTE